MLYHGTTATALERILKEGLLPRAMSKTDEDFLEQASRKQSGAGLADPSWSMEKRTRYYRKIAKYNPRWASDSLAKMGTAAYYGAIPPEAITRYAILSWKDMHPFIRVKACDSSVSVMNFRFLEEDHKTFTSWIFGEDVPIETMVRHYMLLNDAQKAEVQKCMERSGIEVRNRS